MTTPDQPLPSGVMSREAIAQAEIGVTRVTPGTARVLAALFVIAISVVPLIECRAVWSLGREVVADHGTRVQALPEDGGIWSRVVGRNRAVLEGLNAFERGLEDGSLMGRTLRPGAQAVMSGRLGVGNERVYVGRDGWLFYRPDVEYVTGRPFLDPAEIRRRIRAAPEWTAPPARSEEHTSELQSQSNIVCRLL